MHAGPAALDSALSLAMSTAEGARAVRALEVLDGSAGRTAHPVECIMILAKYGLLKQPALYVVTCNVSRAHLITLREHRLLRTLVRESNTNGYAYAHAVHYNMHHYLRALVRAGLALPPIDHGSASRVVESLHEYRDELQQKRLALCALIGSRRYRRSLQLWHVPLPLVVQIAQFAWQQVE